MDQMIFISADKQLFWLIIYNDSWWTFQFIMNCLMDILEHIGNTVKYLSQLI